MAVATTNNNTWYEFINKDTGYGSGLGVSGAGHSQVYGYPFNDTNIRQSWQIIESPSTSGAFVLRNRRSGSDLFMSVFVVDQACETNATSSCIYEGIVMTNSTASTGSRIEWFIEPWNDDDNPNTFYLYPVSNGSSWHLTMQDNGSWLWMSPNVTVAAPKQQWEFRAIDAIDNATYSTVALASSPTTTAATGSSTSLTSTTSASTTSTSTPSPTSISASSGRSTGAKAGIGAGVGGAALILIAILALWLWRRQSLKRSSTIAGQDAEYLTSDKGFARDAEGLHEALGSPVAEAPMDAQRYELDATTAPTQLPSNPPRPTIE